MSDTCVLDFRDWSAQLGRVSFVDQFLEPNTMQSSVAERLRTLDSQREKLLVVEPAH
jgi:hypothetical protein